MISTEKMRIYHPIPFEEYNDLSAWRIDSHERFCIIRGSYGSFSDKSLIDICCANGFFLFKFIIYGGVEAIGVERDDATVNFVNDLAREKSMNITCLKNLPEREFDIGIYLDTHPATTTVEDGYLSFLSKMCKTCFVSTCDATHEEEFKQELLSKFNSVEKIYKGFANRSIFKCA